MRIHRRGFITALLAPFVAKFLPKKIEADSAPHWPFPKFVTSAAQSPGRIDFINLGLFGLRYYDVSGCSENFMGISRAAFGVGEPKTATRAKMQFDSEEWQRGIVKEYQCYIQNARPPGSFHRYMEAERII